MSEGKEQQPPFAEGNKDQEKRSDRIIDLVREIQELIGAQRQEGATKEECARNISSAIRYLEEMKENLMTPPLDLGGRSKDSEIENQSE